MAWLKSTKNINQPTIVSIVSPNFGSPRHMSLVICKLWPLFATFRSWTGFQSFTKNNKRRKKTVADNVLSRKIATLDFPPVTSRYDLPSKEPPCSKSCCSPPYMSITSSKIGSLKKKSSPSHHLNLIGQNVNGWPELTTTPKLCYSAFFVMPSSCRVPVLQVGYTTSQPAQPSVTLDQSPMNDWKKRHNASCIFFVRLRSRSSEHHRMSNERWDHIACASSMPKSEARSGTLPVCTPEDFLQKVASFPFHIILGIIESFTLPLRAHQRFLERF